MSLRLTRYPKSLSLKRVWPYYDTQGLANAQGTERSAPFQDAEQTDRPEPDKVLVQDLLLAAIHSRAAYGYAMQAGHVASVMSFALMHTVHSLR